MGQEGLYVLVLLGLLMVASEGNKGGGTRCWVKGKEVTLRPHQCPAEFDGADFRFCCRLCYGANCCRPRRSRVNLHRCPREVQVAVADQDYTAAPDLTTAPPTDDQDLMTAPDLTTAPPTAPPPQKVDWGYIVFLFLMIIVIFIAITWHFCKMLWKGWPIWEEDVQEETQAIAKDHSSRVLPLQPLRDIVPDNLLRPCSVLDEDQTPYSLAVSQGTHDLPPPHPGQLVVHPQGAHDLPRLYPEPPVVAFRRSRSQGQDDTVVILPRLVAPPEEAASASAPGAVLPREAVTGSASEETGLPEAAADGSASDSTDGGASDSTE